MSLVPFAKILNFLSNHQTLILSLLTGHGIIFFLLRIRQKGKKKDIQEVPQTTLPSLPIKEPVKNILPPERAKPIRKRHSGEVHVLSEKIESWCVSHEWICRFLFQVQQKIWSQAISCDCPKNFLISLLDLRAAFDGSRHVGVSFEPVTLPRIKTKFPNAPSNP